MNKQKRFINIISIKFNYLSIDQLSVRKEFGLVVARLEVRHEYVSVCSPRAARRREEVDDIVLDHETRHPVDADQGDDQGHDEEEGPVERDGLAELVEDTDHDMVDAAAVALVLSRFLVHDDRFSF